MQRTVQERHIGAENGHGAQSDRRTQNRVRVSQGRGSGALNIIGRWAWVGAVVFGLVLAGAGLFMVREGRNAHNEVRDTLSSERIVTPEDAGIPTAPVTGPEEAKAQADVIREHILTITGGKTYAEL